MSNKLPALQFYPGDWKKDIGVQSLDAIDRYVWFECLLLMHDSEVRGVLILNGKPMTDIQIARAINLDNQIVTKALANIKDNGVCGITSDDAIFSRRMVRDEDIRQKRIKAGSMGGNPNLLNQNSSKLENSSKQILTPSSSSSSSSSSSYNKKRKDALTSVDFVFPDKLNRDECKGAVDEWIRHRVELKKPVTKSAIEQLLKKYSERPSDLVRDIKHSVMNGWQGLFAPKVDPPKVYNNQNGNQHTTRPPPVPRKMPWEGPGFIPETRPLEELKKIKRA